LKMIVRQPLLTVGETHASSVSRFTRFNEAALLTVIQLLVPLNARARPNFPAVQVVLEAAPVLFWPEASATVVPLFSFSPSANTNPFEAAGVEVGVQVGVRVGVGVSVLVEVGVVVEVGVSVSADVDSGVGVSVAVDAGTSVEVDVTVGTAVSTGVAVGGAVGVSVGMGVSVGVGVAIGIGVGVEVASNPVDPSVP
jgi:hypothetical protein